ncbi:hypothetical protein FA13DRAFT_143068 [Coprinellus micaceus]|uniref:Uncharacterized protein n=1 Tax=Coprinellus micaceus TaxID=71717 RepID=A0A4Y7SHQ9_COPMI|nr:hypothetical protein FA13DRAFT_143068 [Coprinellus micaceus]
MRLNLVTKLSALARNLKGGDLFCAEGDTERLHDRNMQCYEVPDNGRVRIYSKQRGSLYQFRYRTSRTRLDSFSLILGKDYQWERLSPPKICDSWPRRPLNAGEFTGTPETLVWMGLVPGERARSLLNSANPTAFIFMMRAIAWKSVIRSAGDTRTAARRVSEDILPIATFGPPGEAKLEDISHRLTAQLLRSLIPQSFHDWIAIK